VPPRGALPDLPRQRRPAGQVRHRRVLAEIDPTGWSPLRQLPPWQVPSSTPPAHHPAATNRSTG
jgi:hypothetical protein